MKDNTTKFFLKLLISIVFTLIILILIKASSKFKTLFYKKVYSDNISFAYFNKVYNKYIGSLDIFDNFTLTQPVFNEKLIYENKEEYKEGVKLKLQNNLVPVSESGIVVFIGEKETFGNVVIIQRIDGIDQWYGGINNANVKLYDYVEKGTLLGEVNDYLYMSFKKNGEVIDYEKYLK